MNATEVASYSEAQRDLLMLLAKQKNKHAHCYQCMAGSMTIVLAWLGVDSELKPVRETEDDTT